MSQPLQKPPPKPPQKPKKKSAKNQKTNNKRLQITDSSGWTHVTTNNRARRLPQHPGGNTNKDGNADTHRATDADIEKEELKPAEPPKNLNLNSLNAQFQRHYERWRGSESWGVVRRVLLTSITTPPTHTDTNAGPETGIQNIISIGLGSPSGFLRGGWVDRRQVSVDQLAALVSIKELLGDVKVYAQDPVFNTLDAELFHSLGITVVEHPSAFERVSEGSFLYCPGVERVHLDALLQDKDGKRPRALFGGPLEEMESDVVKRFMDGKTATNVPLFENEKAFWGMRVYL